MKQLTFTLLYGTAIVVSLLTGTAENASAQICEPFSENQTAFQPCPTHPNVSFSIANDSANPDIGDYLRLKDGSGASAVCSGALGSGISTPYTGDWYEKTKDGCQSLCYETRLFESNHVGTLTVDMLGISIMSDSGITDGSAYFRPNLQYSADGGAESGWKQVCVPIDLISPGDDLPGNSFGQWEIAGSNSYSSDWNLIIQDVDQLFLRTDVTHPVTNTSSPDEHIGYDNFCLGDCDGIEPPESTCPDCTLCCPPWTQGQLDGIFEWSQADAGSYNVNYNPSPTLDTQMNSWLAYAKSIRPDIESVNIFFWPTECPHNVSTGSSCPSPGFQPFDVKAATAVQDINMIQWSGSTPGAHKNVELPYVGFSSWSNTGTSLTEPFDINRLYRVVALPLLVLYDGSIEFIGDGWFGDCPFAQMETNFQIKSLRLANGSSKPKTQTKLVAPSQVQRSREYSQMIKSMEQIIKASKTPETKPIKTEWTQWYNTDRPSGNGDYQTIQGLTEKGLACPKPADIECRDSRTKVDSSKNGETVTCNVTEGGNCVNKLQSDGRCNDYEVRLLCPK